MRFIPNPDGGFRQFIPNPDGTVVVKWAEGRMRTLPITEAQVKAYEGGMLVQHAFPHLSTWDREWIISGTTKEEWEALFPSPEEG